MHLMRALDWAGRYLCERGLYCAHLRKYRDCLPLSRHWSKGVRYQFPLMGV